MSIFKRKLSPKSLPVYQQREKILSALQDHQVVVVESPTGSGKTTQLPLILHEAGYGGGGMIGVTQPRRIATISVCEYIAEQLGSPLPGLVGYKMRFEDVTSPETRIKIMTDGTLLQELKNDINLSRYGVIVVDEAHERSLTIDFIIGLLKDVLKRRRDLRVIISSATINPEVFSAYFDNCPIIHISTSVFPVVVIHDPPRDGSPEAMYDKIAEIVKRNSSGRRNTDILVFLPGERDINETISRLKEQDPKGSLLVLPIFGRLSKEEQERVFIRTPLGKTKVVVATNIAETSVTIDGIVTVIDSGLAKLNHYDTITYTSSLVESYISRASCNQRRGRAGRTQPGKCYRVYTKKDYDSRPEFTTEEIHRTDLSEVVLRMAEIGITDYADFDFISPPEKEGIKGAVDTLILLDALAEDRGLSEIGKVMARFPLLPRHSRMIVEAIYNYPDVIEEVVVVAAFLTSQNPFLLPQGDEDAARRAHSRFQDPMGDFISYQKIYKLFIGSKKRESFCSSHYLDMRIMLEIANVKLQLEEIVRDMGIPVGSGGSQEALLCAVSRGLIQFVCARTSRAGYESMTAESIYIHPGSLLFKETPSYIVAGEIIKTNRIFARSVSPLMQSWLPRISMELFRRLPVVSEGRGRGKGRSGNSRHGGSPGGRGHGRRAKGRGNSRRRER